ncbi:uncharacterized MFS-type transporter C09D4.1-like [Copidosoma floridanum]|uniref:uncharacterized MFS-type transporter C09D4.1-like n=1 Tax=Copidosoma floridanum TaxID=29053 RepID=UPI000C6F7517|nr:uncharacterized MFS-type transporter C09D4.1-like [Copidosoma floridanum]
MEKEDLSVLTKGNNVIILSSHEKSDSNSKIVTKVYKRRWLNLGLYVFYSSLVASQWVEYSIIANIVARYYNVSLRAVDWTSMIYMLFYVVFIFPISYLSERIGLRHTIILGSFLCCFGAWIKTLSVTPDRFPVTFAGQSIVALSLVIMLPMPGRVSANWFGSDELSTATSLGIFGPQFGISMMFFLPPFIVKNHEDVYDIGVDLSLLFWGVALASSLNLVLVILFFKDEPKLPPNETRALQKMNLNQVEGFIGPMKQLFTNKSFLILCNSYGLNVGILNVLGTLLSQLFLIHFANAEKDAGMIGLLIIFTGMFGSIMFGIILDKTRKFKETAVTVYFLTLCGQILFSVAILMEVKWMVYVAAIFLGFFMSGYLALGYELAAEYTYPISKNLVSSSDCSIEFKSLKAWAEVSRYLWSKNLHYLFS